MAKKTGKIGRRDQRAGVRAAKRLDLLAEWRKEAGNMTQQDVADAVLRLEPPVRVARESIARYETGEVKNPPIENLEAIYQVFSEAVGFDREIIPEMIRLRIRPSDKEAIRRLERAVEFRRLSAREQEFALKTVGDARKLEGPD